MEPREIKFFPGQYVDIAVPGTDETRSFSMANTSSRDSGQLEFVIRVYPDGLFSHFLDTGLSVGDRLDITGPFGVFTLREGRDSDLIFIGGGAGMAPILCLLRSLAERGITAKRRTTTGRGGRQDLCFEKELRALTGDAAGFPLRAGPCPSRPTATAGRARSASSPTSCGGTRATSPTPTRTSAAHHRWSRPPSTCSTVWACAEKHIYYDKFTTTGEADSAPAIGRAS